MAEEKNKVKKSKRLSRLTTMVIALLVSAVVLVGMHYVLINNEMQAFASTIMGYVPASEEQTALPYPFSIQNVMWIMFFLSFGELMYRAQEARAARTYLHQGYLPHDSEHTILQHRDLTPIFRRVSSEIADEAAMLPRLIYQSVIQFENSRSIDQSANLLNSQMELLAHQLDLRYSNIRYLVWLIPTLGFIGTVYGISLTLAEVSIRDAMDPNLLKVATEKLAIAFDTTLLALMQSAVLMYLLHVIQEKEEHFLNLSCQDCLKNLINRLYVREED